MNRQETDVSFSRITDPRELDDIAHLSAEFNGHSFRYEAKDLEAFSAQLTNPHSFQVLARDENKTAAGFLASSETLFPGYLFISELLVDRSAQGKGIGKSLVEHAIAFAKSEGLKGVYVETEAWNLPAQALYARCGFQEVDNPGWKDGPTYKLGFTR